MLNNKAVIHGFIHLLPFKTSQEEDLYLWSKIILIKTMELTCKENESNL